MYRIKLAVTENEILEFENLRNIVFHGIKPIEKMTQSPYAQAIIEGDLLALQCLEDETLVGGMLIGLQGENLDLLRLFVDKDKREQGAGKFMVKYLDEHKAMFEDYYGTEIRGIVTSPTLSGIDYYYNRGFSSSGYQMFKKYEDNGRK